MRLWQAIGGNVCHTSGHYVWRTGRYPLDLLKGRVGQWLWDDGEEGGLALRSTKILCGTKLTMVMRSKGSLVWIPEFGGPIVFWSELKSRRIGTSGWRCFFGPRRCWDETLYTYEYG